MAAANEQQLTHDEIWDDSALVNSWNDALEEYKKYHSIHSKGGNVDDLLDNGTTMISDAKEAAKIPEPPSVDDGFGDNTGGDPELRSEKAPLGINKFRDANETKDAQSHGERKARDPAQPVGYPSSIAWSRCHVLADGDAVRDESIKKLLMSWYYAGYYTGYHEAQRDQSRPAGQG